MLKFCSPDQVEQQVERAFEGLEEDLQRVGRDVQIGRQREQRLAVEPGHGDAVDDAGPPRHASPVARRSRRSGAASRSGAVRQQASSLTASALGAVARSVAVLHGTLVW